jgi:hypothetical protein
MSIWRQLPIVLIAAVALPAATLEKLSLEQLASKASLIVRGRVEGCSGEAVDRLIFTRCQLRVLETWKGGNGAEVTVYVPGGVLGGLRQSFSGAPQLASGQEYVFFLWKSPSGRHQILGLSQGLFAVQSLGLGQPVAARPAASEPMVNAAGQPVSDAPLELALSELKRLVQRSLAKEQQ